MRLAAVVPLFGSMSVVLAACAAQTGEPPPSDIQFDDAVADLSDEFGGSVGGKADIFGLDPCQILSPVLSGTDATIRSGFFFGVEGNAVLGGVEGVGGYDVVFDIYHHQMTVSRYLGAGVGIGLAGGSVEVYAGFATGFQHSVSDWDGYFVTAEAELSLPFLREFLSVNPSVFVSGVDRNGDGFIAPDEALLPPEGVYGFAVGVEVGLEVPTGLPVGGTLTEGLWEPQPEAIRYYYDLLAGTRFARIGRHLSVRLVDEHTGFECDPGWPAVAPEQECVIEFGEEEWSHTRRGLHMAYGICTASGGCGVPISWPMSAASIAVGAVRDVGDDLSMLCPDLAARTGEH